MRSDKLIYFDQAATSYPKPKTVLEAVARAIQEQGGNPGRSAHRLSVQASDLVFSVREKICRFFEAPAADRVVFTKNATEALNLAIFSALRNGGHALCSNMEHNAVLRPLLHLKREGKADFDIFESKEFSKEKLQSLLRKDTKILILNHASNVCGRVQSPMEIGSFCAENGILFVLDASQSAGHIPISMQKMKIDILCAPAHKGLHGILGLGFAVFRTQKSFPPFLYGGSGVYSLDEDMPKELPERYEAGSLSVPAIAALGAGMEFVKEKGVEEIEKKVLSLERFLKEELLKRPFFRVWDEKAEGSGNVSFTHERFSPSLFAELLDSENVAVRAGYHCAPLAHRSIGSIMSGTVRIGLGAFNTFEECEEFIERIDRLIK